MYVKYWKNVYFHTEKAKVVVCTTQMVFFLIHIVVVLRKSPFNNCIFCTAIIETEDDRNTVITLLYFYYAKSEKTKTFIFLKSEQTDCKPLLNCIAPFRFIKTNCIVINTNNMCIYIFWFANKNIISKQNNNYPLRNQKLVTNLTCKLLVVTFFFEINTPQFYQCQVFVSLLNPFCFYRASENSIWCNIRNS